MRKRILNIFSTILGINLFILILYLAFMPNALNRKTYYKVFEQADFQIYYENASGKLDHNVTLPKTEIKRVLDLTLNYMVKKTDSLQTEVTFSDGTVTKFYDQNELNHMEDCQHLFTAFRLFCLIILIISIFLLTSIIILRTSFSYKTIKFFFIGLSITSGLILIIAVYGLIDFMGAFALFHKIFFPQGNWRFSYHSYMIQMLPSDAIFNKLAYQIIICFFIYIFILIGSLIGLYIYLKKKQKTKIIA